MNDLRPPLQRRSQDTLDAIANATSRLLQTQSFNELTIQAIVAEAGSSAGSFYARFKGKRALLHYLHEDFAETSVEQLSDFIAASGIEPVTPSRLAELLVPELVRSHNEHRGILRAALIESLEDPLFVERAAKFVRSVAEVVAEVTLRTATRKERHIANVAQSILAVVAVLDQGLFHEKGGRGRVSNAEIARLRRIFVASLPPESDS